MTYQQLQARRDEIRASMTREMSMQAFQAAQARIQLMTNAMTAVERAEAAHKAMQAAVEEAVKWGL